MEPPAMEDAAPLRPRKQRSRLILSFCAAFALVLGGCATCEPQPNLGLYKQKLVQWHNSGDYAACFARTGREAILAFRSELSRVRPGTRPAVVLDIDETALSNWGYLTEVGFNINAATFRQWTARHNDPALPTTLELFREARAKNVPVFFITGRKEGMRANTERQLRAAGYGGWSGLYLCPNDYAKESIVPFKSGVRQKLEQEGWHIIVNMGDQWSDLEGGYSVRKIKLPNPYYFIR
jgi:predicted secreted acid phosphatase